MVKSKGKPKAKQDAIKLGDDALKKIRADYGEGVVFKASNLVTQKREVVRTGSPAVDVALGGGFIAGTSVTLSGPSGCGKTTLSLAMCREWQKKGYKVVIFPTEHRLSARDFEGCEGLDVDAIDVIQSDEHKVLAAQDILSIADQILRAQRHTLVLFDSFSMLADSDDMKSSGYEQGRPAALNIIVGKFVKNMTPVLPLNQNVLVGIFHTYANINGHTANKSSIPSKVEFFRSTGLEAGYPSFLSVDQGDKKDFYGQEVSWRVLRTMLPGACTGTTAKNVQIYGKGVSVSRELIALGQLIGAVSKNGAWFALSTTTKDGKPVEVKKQGENAMSEWLDENVEVRDALYDRVLEILL